MKKNINFLVIFSLILLLFTSCGIGKKLKDFHEPVDLRNSPLDPDERARRNIEEGRGISLGGIGNSKTTYEKTEFIFIFSSIKWFSSINLS